MITLTWHLLTFPLRLAPTLLTPRSSCYLWRPPESRTCDHTDFTVLSEEWAVEPVVFEGSACAHRTGVTMITIVQPKQNTLTVDLSSHFQQWIYAVQWIYTVIRSCSIHSILFIYIKCFCNIFLFLNFSSFTTVSFYLFCLFVFYSNPHCFLLLFHSEMFFFNFCLDNSIPAAF